jgi:phospholipid-binding lipoprotein MlaA
MKVVFWVPTLVAFFLIGLPCLATGQSLVAFSSGNPWALPFDSNERIEETSLFPVSSQPAVLIISMDTKSADPSASTPEMAPGPTGSEAEYEEGPAVAPGAVIPDPFEPLNRAAFQFNDTLYFAVFKPVATGYQAVVPQSFRVCWRNFFSNLTTPIRAANCLLQGRFKCVGNETARFFINSTLGFAGWFDQGKDKFDIAKSEADLGQTLGVWGVKPAFYIHWVIFGPSSLRETVGFVGDLAFDPRTYIFNPVIYLFRPWEMVNEESLRLGEYEDFKKAALDPYVAMRDAYTQYRQNKIKNYNQGDQK